MFKKILCNFSWFTGELLMRCEDILAFLDFCVGQECVESWRSPNETKLLRNILKNSVLLRGRNFFFLNDKCLDFSVKKKKGHSAHPGCSSFCHVGSKLSCVCVCGGGKAIWEEPWQAHWASLNLSFSYLLFLSLYGCQAIFRVWKTGLRR